MDGARLLVLAAADSLDRHGFKGAAGAIAAAKVAAPNAVLRVLDAAMQVRHTWHKCTPVMMVGGG